MKEEEYSCLQSYVLYNSAMSDKSSTMSTMSDKSSELCACPMDVPQYGPSKFPAKSLGVYTQSYRETFQEFSFHIPMADVGHQGSSSVVHVCPYKEHPLHASLVLCLLSTHTWLEGKA